jgi:TonB-dependent receptor
MTKTSALGRLLLVSTALATALSTSPALAQSSPTGPTTPTTPAAPPAGGPGTSATAAQAGAAGPADPVGTGDQVDVSVPGASLRTGDEIIVRGRYIPNVVRSTPAVVSVLSTEDIARTGEGDIAGALQRVTGLSVVGNGFVYVRGLGDRYSLALLNGLPLPSPEPLRRVVPLDIFPTNLVASSLVQKSYSANYPGEFGGGVINLTTQAVPEESFLSLGVGGGIDTETTGKLGYTYEGGDIDFFGFDDGTRDVPAGIAEAIRTGTPINAGSNYSAEEVQAIAASLNNAETSLLQRNRDIPANFSAELSAGTAWDVGDNRLGLIFSAGYSNNWRTRSALQQLSLDPGLAGIPQESFRSVITDNRAIVNGLLGVGFEFGEHKLRWTNVYIRDTLKQGRLSAGYSRNVADQDPALPPSLLQQNTYWFERQLITSQIVGEFEFDALSVDVRGAYANSQRESPYERGFSYRYTTELGINDYVNDLSSGGQSADVAFSDLSEDVYAGGIDLSYELPSSIPVTLSAGYGYTKTERQSSRYQYQFFRPEGALPIAVAQERPDYLVSDYNIYTYGIQLRDVSTTEGAAAYGADLEVHAGYAQAEAEVMDGLRLVAGVRYEDGDESVVTLGSVVPATSLQEDYWLPAATLTWNFDEDMQLRLNGSKTIARPQFRELAPQIYQDFESDRQFTGNPFLTDSELWNAELRYEWYFGEGESLNAAGFYKKIDNPIEAVAFFAGGGALRTGFANAPEAELYGGEVEVTKYLPLDTVIGGEAFDSRRVVLAANYTYTQSKLKVDDSIVIGPDGGAVAANVLFEDGAPLTGQSDHIVNLQLGLEDTDRLSQQTILLTYASTRATNRGPIAGLLRQPDIIEKPGLRLDFVAREGVTLLGTELELKFEGRNLTGEDYQEYQSAGENRIDINSYDLGRTFSLSVTAKF